MNVWVIHEQAGGEIYGICDVVIGDGRTVRPRLREIVNRRVGEMIGVEREDVHKVRYGRSPVTGQSLYSVDVDNTAHCWVATLWEVKT